MPIYEVAAAQELCTELWGAAGGPRSEFERLADLALAVAAFKEADETGGQGVGKGVYWWCWSAVLRWCRAGHGTRRGRCASRHPSAACMSSHPQHPQPLAGELLGLEQRGLALSATALRFAYAYGGDGEVRRPWADGGL